MKFYTFLYVFNEMKFARVETKVKNCKTARDECEIYISFKFFYFTEIVSIPLIMFYSAQLQN